MARVTLQSIADRVGVSRMTVSNAYSRPDQLSADLRDRILAEAAALGYHGPDPAARSLATGTSGAIGVLWTQPLRISPKPKNVINATYEGNAWRRYPEPMRLSTETGEKPS